MTLYFDASAFTKLFIAEEGTEHADELWALETSLVSSAITYAETSAAIASARRARRLSQGRMSEALLRLDEEWRAITLVDVDDPLTRTAGLLAVRHGLRGMDAIHLASALTFASARPVVVTWDTDLCNAARSEGLAVSP